MEFKNHPQEREGVTKDREPCLEGEAGTPSADLYTAVPCRGRSRAAQEMERLTAGVAGSSRFLPILTDLQAATVFLCVCLWRYGLLVSQRRCT